MRPEASFDPAPGGFRFSLRYRVREDVRATVILLPPLAEELNRCRRMIAKTARAFCAAGYEVLQRDPLGCGDSSGDFGDARWDAWLDDLGQLIDETPRERPLWLWAIRGGALLAPPLLTRRGAMNLLLWNPLHSGEAAMNQWLRLRTAASAMNSAGERNSSAALRAALANGEALEIGGYLVAPALAASIGGARLDLPERFGGRVAWLEVADMTDAGPSLAPAGEPLRARWGERGVSIEARAVSGLRFWQTQEISECDALIDASLRSIGPA